MHVLHTINTLILLQLMEKYIYKAYSALSCSSGGMWKAHHLYNASVIGVLCNAIGGISLSFIVKYKIRTLMSNNRTQQWFFEGRQIFFNCSMENPVFLLLHHVMNRHEKRTTKKFNINIKVTKHSL